MLGMENGSSHCGGHWAEENEDKIRTLLMPTKINCRQIKGLNKWTDTTKLLREKRRIHTDIKCRKFFFDPFLRIRINKTEINKWRLINV